MVLPIYYFPRMRMKKVKGATIQYLYRTWKEFEIKGQESIKLGSSL